MSDARKVKANLLPRIRQWVRGALVEDVPPDRAACEFDCRDLECSQGKWETCGNRLRRMSPDKA